MKGIRELCARFANSCEPNSFKIKKVRVGLEEDKAKLVLTLHKCGLADNIKYLLAQSRALWT